MIGQGQTKWKTSNQYSIAFHNDHSVPRFLTQAMRLAAPSIRLPAHQGLAGDQAADCHRSLPLLGSASHVTLGPWFRASKNPNLAKPCHTSVLSEKSRGDCISVRVCVRSTRIHGKFIKRRPRGAWNLTCNAKSSRFVIEDRRAESLGIAVLTKF